MTTTGHTMTGPTWNKRLRTHTATCECGGWSGYSPNADELTAAHRIHTHIVAHHPPRGRHTAPATT